MNSPFSINSKTHRAKYQQPMCGTTIFNIGAPPSYNFGSSIMNHFNRNFSMSSCNLGISQQQQSPHVGIDINKGIKHNNGDGIVSNLINMMKMRKPILQASAKEFPDFNHMPMSSASSSFCMVEPKQTVYLNSTNVQPIPTPSPTSYSYFTTPESAFSANASNTVNTMNDLKSFVSANCTQDDTLVPETTKSCGQSFMNKKKKKRSGKGKNKTQSNHNSNINTNKFHHHASNLHKNLHEKERHCIERDITDDYCDILGALNQVDDSTEGEPLVVLPEIASKDEAIPVELNRTFEFYSLEEFPEILQDCPVALTSGTNKKRTTNKCTKSQKASKLTAAHKHQEIDDNSDTDDEFIIFKDDTPDSTPSFSPKPMNLCAKLGKIIKKPTSPLKSSFSPCKILSATKLHCMKPKRERFLSECSDDSFVVFCDSGASSSCDVNEQTDFDSELDMSDDSDDSESDDDSTDEDDGDVEDETPEAQQLDSGIEERKVIFY